MDFTEKSTSQHLFVHWDKCQTNLLSSFEKLLNSEQFVDVTLAVESQTIKCHKLVLSASSTYFEKILLENPCQHPVIIMRGMKYWEVLALVNFMYRGEVSVEEGNLELLLKSAEALQIHGLAGDRNSDRFVKSEEIEDRVISDNGEQNVSSDFVQSELINCTSERKTTVLKSECTNPGISSKSKKACYRDSLPSFKKPTTDTKEYLNVIKNTPLDPFMRLDPKENENIIIKEELDMDFNNTEEVTVNPSLDFAVLQGEEVNLNESITQIEESDPGPSFTPDHNKGVQDEFVAHIRTTGYHFLDNSTTYIGVGKNKRRVRRNCKMCYQRAAKLGRIASKSSKKVTTFCNMCPQKPYLCKDCFKLIHSQVSFFKTEKDY